MLSCYLKCRKNTEIKNSKVRRKKKNGKNNALSKCEVCDKIKIYQRATS